MSRRHLFTRLVERVAGVEMGKRDRRLLTVIFLSGFALRIAWTVYAARPPAPELHDPAFYRFFAEQIANGNGYRLLNGQPTAYYPVGYPMTLGAVFWLVFHSPIPDAWLTGIVAALNIVWQMIMIAAVFRLARRLTTSVPAGLVAAGWSRAGPTSFSTRRLP
ncbi:MAG: hypothetical protein ACR2H3_15950 [Acidimicrobiales bacterium]